MLSAAAAAATTAAAVAATMAAATAATAATAAAATTMAGHPDVGKMAQYGDMNQGLAQIGKIAPVNERIIYRLICSLKRLP